MMERNLPHKSLAAEKRTKLSEYVRSIVEKSKSLIDDSDAKGVGTALFVVGLGLGIENKSWRLASAIDGGGKASARTAAEIPYDSTVVLRVGALDGPEGNLGYCTC